MATDLKANPDSSMKSLAGLLGIDPDVLVGGLNLVEAAHLLGIAPSTLRTRAIGGQIGCQRDGRRWIFFWDHLAHYLNDREQTRSPHNSPSGAGESAGRNHPAEVLREAARLGLLSSRSRHRSTQDGRGRKT